MSEPIKKCRHGRGLTGPARRRAWRACRCTWLADVRIDGAREYIPLGRDETQARVAYHRLLAGIADGRGPTPVTLTIRDLGARWIEAHKAAGRKPRTIEAYGGYVRVIDAALGDAGPGDITGHTLREFRRAQEAAGRSPRYAGFLTGALTGMLRWAHSEGVIDHVPVEARGVVHVAPAGVSRRRLSIEECERLIACLPRGWHDAGEVILLTGLRIGELLALTPGSVDATRGVLHVTATRGHGNLVGSPKTMSSRRVVHLTPRACQLLEARVVLTRPGEFLWPGSVTGAAADAMRHAKKEAGLQIRGVGWHALRHAATMLMDRAGLPLRASAQQLGHGAHTAMTMGYGWAAEGADVARLDEVRTRHAAPGAPGTVGHAESRGPASGAPGAPGPPPPATG